MKEITIGLSPCPNDTYIFYRLLHNNELPFRIRPVICDVERLNVLVLKGMLDVSKVSFALAARVLSDYVILETGAAIGRGCGPLILARKEVENPKELQEKPFAIPGRHTTAAMLLKIYLPGIKYLREMLFSNIPEAIASGQVFAGCCIHETRFTYKSLGLIKITDLGEWWEETTGLPIPLGGIVARRDMDPDILKAIERAICQSIEYADANFTEVLPYIKKHAQEMKEDVIRKHIALYVNDYSKYLGVDGRNAIRKLFEFAWKSGIFQINEVDRLFLSDLH